MEEESGNDQEKVNAEIGNRIFQQVMSLCILPEIAIKQSDGTFPTPFEIRKVLVIFHPDGMEREVRFNDDVSVVTQVKLKEGIGKKKGEPIYINEVDGIGESELIDEENLDSGYVLLINKGASSWLMSFDFRYNKNTSRKHIERANEFLECAEFSLQRQLFGSFIDNLYSATELLAKALLMTFADPKIKGSKKHDIIKNKFNKFVYLGNSRIEYTEAINKLNELRRKGRYLHGDISMSEDEAKILINHVKMMRDEVKRKIYFLIIINIFFLFAVVKRFSASLNKDKEPTWCLHRNGTGSPVPTAITISSSAARVAAPANAPATVIPGPETQFTA